MNTELLSRLYSMSTKQVYEALYTDTLTGVYNRRAFNELRATYYWWALVDLDSLKYINDARGYRAGDESLIQLAQRLEREFPGRVFRLAGDEFAVGMTPRDLSGIRLSRLRGNYPRFSFGIGHTLDEADINLKADKTRRLYFGERAARGECPPWFPRTSALQGAVYDD